MTPNLILAQIEQEIRGQGAIPRFFQSSTLDCFSIVSLDVPYVAINTSLPEEHLLEVTKRELAIVKRLSDGESSLFYKVGEKS